jgi:hypothetical protein
MKKISTLLATASIATLAALTAAADCAGGGGVAVDCETDEDCAGELENTICDLDLGVCVAPAEDVCADAVDCDLANSASPSTATDCETSDDSGCDAAGGEVCVADGVGVTYCVLADDPALPCADIDDTFASATVDGKDVCVVDSGNACTEGQCVGE